MIAEALQRTWLALTWVSAATSVWFLSVGDGASALACAACGITFLLLSDFNVGE